MEKNPALRALSIVSDVCFVALLTLMVFVASDPVTVQPDVEDQVLEER